MKKLSFLELEKEMRRENKLLEEEDKLRSIKGGMQQGVVNEMKTMIVDNIFQWKETTVVNNRGMVHSQTTNPNTDDNNCGIEKNYGINTKENNFPTTSIPLDPDQAYLISFVWDNFDLYNYYFSSEFLSGASNIPVGYDLISDQNSIHFGQYHTKMYDEDTDEVVDSYSWAVSYGGKEFGQFKSETYISPGAVENFSDERLIGTIGHEMVHDNNMRAHKQLYLSGKSGNGDDMKKFKLNSEYAAWKFEYKYYQSKGNTQLKNAAYQKMQSINNNANDLNIDIENWDWHLPGGFVSTTNYHPSTTISSTTLPPGN